ncbi:MAG: hypothetical protein LC687_07925, partial [Actinobacteria bacterium]|nr:hypothetical protein [Actinomycetota bacterium]
EVMNDPHVRSTIPQETVQYARQRGLTADQNTPPSTAPAQQPAQQPEPRIIQPGDDDFTNNPPRPQ